MFNLYFFFGRKDYYRGKPANIVSLGFMKDNDYLSVSNADETKSCGKLFSECLPLVSERIKELEIKDKVICFVPSPTIREESEEFKLLLNLMMSTNDADEVKRRIKSINVLEETREYLYIVEDTIRHFKDSGFEIKLKWKESKESITGVIQADASALRAFWRLIRGEQALANCDYIAKEHKAKTKDECNLLMDNLLFYWGRTEVEGMSVYFSGNGDLENKRPKSEKVDPITSKAFVYFGGNNRRLRVLGKLSAEDRYNVTILKEPVEYLNKLYAMQDSVCSQLYNIRQMTVFRKDVAFGGGVSNFIEAGDNRFLAHSDHGDVFTTAPPRKDVSYVFNPPRLAFKVKRELETNERKLVNVINGTAANVGITLTNITDTFFEADGDKVILSKSLATDAKVIKIPNIVLPTGSNATLKLIYKEDIPEIKHFKKLLKDSPKVEIATWMVDEHTVGYAMVISTDAGWLWYCSQYGGRYLLRSASKKARGE